MLDQSIGLFITRYSSIAFSFSFCICGICCSEVLFVSFTCEIGWSFDFFDNTRIRKTPSLILLLHIPDNGLHRTLFFAPRNRLLLMQPSLICGDIGTRRISNPGYFVDVPICCLFCKIRPVYATRSSLAAPCLLHQSGVPRTDRQQLRSEIDTRLTSCV